MDTTPAPLPAPPSFQIGSSPPSRPAPSPSITEDLMVAAADEPAPAASTAEPAEPTGDDGVVEADPSPRHQITDALLGSQFSPETETAAGVLAATADGPPPLRTDQDEQEIAAGLDLRDAADQQITADEEK